MDTAPRRLRVAALLAAALSGSAGLGSACAEGAGERRRVVDATGASVALPPRPERIVVLAPELAEILAMLGAGPAIVGRCDACDRPAAILALPDVGPMISPSIERILVLRPDLVLASSQGNPLDVLQRLRDLGLPAFGIAPGATGLAGVVEEFRAVASVAGLSAEGERVVAEFEADLAAVRARVASVPRVSACCFAWTDPLIAAGAGSFLDEILDVAGVDNACAVARTVGGAPEAYPRISREQLLLARPRVILLATGRDETDLFAGWGESVPAVRDGRVLVLDPDLFLRPTPRLAEAAGRLVDLLAPLRAETAAPMPPSPGSP